ncbi:MAG: DegV family protein [Anaerolineales bacterium]|jgi:DegV family protein with EDD domain
MSEVAIVTDSTADIPHEMLKKYQIQVAPQILIWDNQTYQDGVDIHPREFYQKLQKAKTIPTTSQATPEAFREIFEKELQDGKKVLAILISDQLSGTIASAQQAKELFPGEPIEIINSYTAAMAMGFQVVAAARAAQEGANLAECKSIAERARQHTGVLFAVDTLEFLYRGGRIGGATRLLGTAINIKPILEISEGHVEPIERVRTRKKSLSRLIELAEQRIDGRHPVHMAILHASVPEQAEKTLSQVNGKFESVETFCAEVGPVLGTHVGPGTLGIAYMAGM